MFCKKSVAHCQVYKYGKEAEVQVYTQEIWLRIIAVVAGGNRKSLCINKLIHVASSNTLWKVKVT